MTASRSLQQVARGNIDRPNSPAKAFRTPHKCYRVEQIVAKLRKADKELSKGKKAAFTCKLQEIISSSHRTDVFTAAGSSTVA